MTGDLREGSSMSEAVLNSQARRTDLVDETDGT